MLLHFRDDDGERAVEVTRLGDGWRVTIDCANHELEAVPDGEGGWCVTWDGRRRHVRVAARGDERFVFSNGRAHRLRIVDPDHADGSESAGTGPSLSADMPGKVVRVLVEPGVAVTVGDPLVILESMKMETELAAAVAGRVARVHVAAGQVVAQGDPLVDIEPSTEDVS